MVQNNNIICQIYNKKYCIPTYSGSLAIEGVLKSLNLKKQARVLISSISCYSILETVLNANLTPVIATPQNGVVFTKKEIISIIKSQNIKVYIAVDQYGYRQELPDMNDVIIISDISQSWNLLYASKRHVEYQGDYIITSLGKSKPLNNGIGGLIITNIDITNKFDLKRKNDRYIDHKLLEYYYPLKINYRKLIKKANKKVKLQRRNAKLFDNIFEKYSFIRIFKNDKYMSSYHRYVISIPNKYKEEIKTIFNKAKINYELEYKIKLTGVPVAKKNKLKTIESNKNNYIFILIKPNNCLLNIIKLKREMEKQYER